MDPLSFYYVWEGVLWEIIGSVAAILTMFGFLPQLLKIMRKKSVEDVSLPMLVQFSAGVFLWLLYGIHIDNYILIVANTVSLFLFLFGIGLYIKYSDWRRPHRPPDDVWGPASGGDYLDGPIA